jgi:hypothetical protein
MQAPAAITGDYVDIRFVKTRKVCQVVIELPIEAGASFVAAFGTPNPAGTVPVAIARLIQAPQIEAQANPVPVAALTRKGGKLAKKAGMLCSKSAFWKFMGEQAMGTPTNADEAAEVLRRALGIQSRSEIDHDELAATAFKAIESSYQAWMRVA